LFRVAARIVTRWLLAIRSVRQPPEQRRLRATSALVLAPRFEQL